MTEASYVVARFVQRYDKIQNVEAAGPIKYLTHLSMRSGTGVQVKLHQDQNFVTS